MNKYEKMWEHMKNALLPLGQLKFLLDMCDEHCDNIKFAVEMYMRANRDEIGTIE